MSAGIIHRRSAVGLGARAQRSAPSTCIIFDVPEPVIVARADHPISRRDIDPDALKVLYRLHSNNHAAYLVGGSVRDLILGRRPKDFDVGTDAHPYQIKKLFRNCWIIGRRFRLAHIKFGQKTIEVATFRRNVPEPPPEAGAEDDAVVAASAPADAIDGAAAMIHRDNTFGTPEEDAFRRDFTINGLFYDIASYAVIDYVGGLGDLERRVIRSIGDPHVRFVEDPVRMLRAAVLAARLGFDMDEQVLEAIARHRELILKASPARLLEEYFKILRSGYAEASFRALARVRLLELVTPDLQSPSDAVWESLARLDTFRQRFPTAPAELTNTVLIGALLVPLRKLERRGAGHQATGAGHVPRTAFGMLQIAKKDLERLRQLMQLLPRLADPNLPPRVARGIAHRPGFADTLTWFEIYGDSPESVEHWRQLKMQRQLPRAASATAVEAPPFRRRRRRRRRGRGRRGPAPG
jgi:poly(A) polymerase